MYDCLREWLSIAIQRTTVAIARCSAAACANCALSLRWSPCSNTVALRRQQDILARHQERQRAEAARAQAREQVQRETEEHAGGCCCC
jgi:hypothetical protein